MVDSRHAAHRLRDRRHPGWRGGGEGALDPRAPPGYRLAKPFLRPGGGGEGGAGAGGRGAPVGRGSVRSQAGGGETRAAAGAEAGAGARGKGRPGAGGGQAGARR